LQIPVGPPEDTKVVNKRGFTLNYNEFIVYDTKQIKMKYLEKIKFNKI
jgi:poly [ADP-ribose] polymerase